MQIRTTQQSAAARAMAGLQGNLSRLGTLQERLSSGKQLTRPSDSPTGTVSAMQLRAQHRATQQYVRNATDGLGWLGTIDTTLSSGLSQVRRVRDLTLQGMSAGAAGSRETREALAVEVDNIRESLINLANTRYLNRPIFGGTTPGGVAYDPTGAYVGDSGQVLRTVGDGSKVRVDSGGEQVFGTGETQLFTVLKDISEYLRAGGTVELGTALGRLDTALNRMSSQLADVGARYNRVEQMRQNAEDGLLGFQTQLSDVEDIDLPKTIMDLKLQETAYEAALAATAKVIQPSLVDFLR